MLEMPKAFNTKIEEWFSINPAEFKAVLIATFIIILSWIYTEDKATVVAVCAMLATFWQAWISREHNKLSVRPWIDTHGNRTKDSPVNLEIVNNGAGTAIIKKLQFNYKGKEIENESLGQIFRSYDIPNLKADIISIQKDYYLRAGEKIELISLKNSSENENKNIHSYELDFIDNLGFEITYESIYKEKLSYLLERAL